MPVLAPGVFAGHVVLENQVSRPRAFVAYRYRHGLSDEQTLGRWFAPNRSDVDFGAVFLAGAGDAQESGIEEPSPCAIDWPVPEHVILRCLAKQAGYAVLLDEWTRGWSATVDGVAAPIERADVVFRALSPGQHRVEMRYRTPGLRTGAMVSLVACLVFLVLALLGFRLFGSGWWRVSRPPRRVPQA